MELVYAFFSCSYNTIYLADVLVGKNDAILVLCILGPVIVSYTSSSELSSSLEKVAKTDNFKPIFKNSYEPLMIHVSKIHARSHYMFHLNITCRNLSLTDSSD